jgi:hypothetical protein
LTCGAVRIQAMSGEQRTRMMLFVMMYLRNNNHGDEVLFHILTAHHGLHQSKAAARPFFRTVRHAMARLQVDEPDEPFVPMDVTITEELLHSIATDFPALRSLCIRADCRLVTDVGVGALTKRLPNLRHLTLHAAHGLTDACMPALVNLTELVLHNASALTDHGLHTLSSASLTSLTLSACENVTPAALQELSALRKLTSLSLAWCFVNDDVVRSLSSLPALTALSLTHTKLAVGFNGVTDVGVRTLSNSKLASLDLSFTAVTDEGAAALADLATLTHLTIGYTAVTPEGVSRLQRSRQSAWPELVIKLREEEE